AEDGIRDFHVTGVQTCALPIYDAVVHQHHGLVVQVLPDGVQLDTYCHLALLLGSHDEGPAHVPVLQEALDKGRARTGRVPDGICSPRVRHRADRIRLHRVLLEELLADLPPDVGYKCAVEVGDCTGKLPAI